MKKRIWAMLLCLSLLLSMLSGCGKKQEEDPTAEVPETPEQSDAAAPEEEAKEPDAVGIAWQSDADIHPYTCMSVTNQAIISLLYESLFVVTADFQTEALLCTKTAVSDSGLIWYFEIRDDVMFSDGTPLTSIDVVESLRAAKASSIYQTRCRIISSLDTRGDHAFIIKLNYKNENLPMLLDLPIAKASTLENAVPLGTGPYAKQGETLVRNARWWQNTDPVINADTIQLVEANTPNDVRNAFEFGGADLAYVDTSASALSAYYSDNERWGCSTTVMEYLGFNQTGNYFFSAELRAALTYAVDRASIVSEIYDGFGVEASLPCAPQATFYDNGLADNYAFNLGDFNAMLQASGISPDPADPVMLIVSASNDRRVETANFIARQFNELGLFTTVEVLEPDDFQYRLYIGEFDLYLADIRLTPTLDLEGFFYSGSGSCYGSMESENVRTLCRNAMENSGNYYDLHREIMRRGLLVPIFFKSYALYATRGVIGSHTPSVTNLFISGTGVPAADLLAEEAYVDQPVQTGDSNAVG